MNFVVDANKRMKFQTTGNGQNELNGLAGSVRRERDDDQCDDECGE